MTAGHCICPEEHWYALYDQKKYPTHELSRCKKSSHQNQITPGFIEAKVYGGHKDTDELQSYENIENTFDIILAFVKFSSSSLYGSKSYMMVDKDDLAVLVTDRNLFDKEFNYDSFCILPKNVVEQKSKAKIFILLHVKFFVLLWNQNVMIKITNTQITIITI